MATIRQFDPIFMQRALLAGGEEEEETELPIISGDITAASQQYPGVQRAPAYDPDAEGQALLAELTSYNLLRSKSAPPVQPPAQSEPAQRSVLERIGDVAIPVGETALALGTGALGAGVGATTFIGKAIADLGRPKSSDYWKELYEQYQNVAKRFTYEPRSEAGKTATGIVAAPFGLLQEFSRAASEAPLAKLVLSDDQRYALRFAHELVTGVALGHVAGAAVRPLRSKVAKFRNEFAKANETLPSEAPELVASAEDLMRSVENNPAASEALAEARQRGRFPAPAAPAADITFGDLSDPASLARARRAYPQLFDEPQATEVTFPEPEPPVPPPAAPEPIPGVPNLSATLGGRPPLRTAQRTGAEIAAQSTTEAAPSTLPAYLQEAIDQRFAMGQRLNIVADVERLAAEGLVRDQIITRLRNEGKLPPAENLSNMDAREIVGGVRAKLRIPSQTDPQDFIAWQQQYFQRQQQGAPTAPTVIEPAPAIVKPTNVARKRVVPAPTVAEARRIAQAAARPETVEAERLAQAARTTEQLTPAEMRASQEAAIAVRAGEPSEVGPRMTGAPGAPTVAEAQSAAAAQSAEAAQRLSVPTVAESQAAQRAEPFSAVSRLASRVPTTAEARATRMEQVARETVINRAQRARARKRAAQSTAEPSIANEAAPGQPTVAAPTARSAVSYETVNSRGIRPRLSVAESVGDDTPGASGALQVRRVHGVPDALFIDNSGMDTTMPHDVILRSKTSGKMQPEVADRMLAELQRQADAFGVPIEQAHKFTGKMLLDEMQYLADKNSLELYRARKSPTGDLEYEQISPASIKAGAKLESGNTLESSGITKSEAGAFVEERTKSPGNQVIEDMARAIERGEDISDILPPDIKQHFTDIYTKHMEGLDDSSPRNFSAIMRDILDLIAPGDVDPTQLGMLSIYGLTPARRAAARRLWGDAQKIEAVFRDKLDSTNLSETDKLLIMRYIDSISKPPIPKGISTSDLRLDPAQSAGSDPMVHQRVISRKGQQIKMAPKYKSEIDAIQRAPLYKQNVRGLIRKFDLNTPYHALRRANLLDVFYRPYQRAQRAASRENQLLQQDLTSLTRGLPKASRERVMEYAFGQSPQGRNILKQNGRVVPTLSSNELGFYKAARNLYDTTFERINEARIAIGREPLDYEPNYFTFMRSFTIAENLNNGPNLLLSSKDAIKKHFQNYSNVPFPYAKKRTGATYTAEMDAFRVLNQYMQSANRQIHLAPFVAKMDELINRPLPDPRSGKLTWRLANQNPKLHEYLQDWKSFVSTGVDTSLPQWAKNSIYGAMGNLSLSLLGGSLRTAGVQLGALRGTLYDFGPRWLASGITDSLSDLVLRTKNRDFAMRNSKVLDTRGLSDAYNQVTASFVGGNPKEFLSAVRSGRVLEVQQALGRPAFKVMEIMDREAAMMTWRAAYNFATKQLRHSQQKAVNIADDAVVRTQGGTMPGDVAAIQRSLAGKTFTQFQRFLINDFNTFMEDVLGPKESARLWAEIDGVPPAQGAGMLIANAMKFTAATTAFNIFFEDLMGISTPFPSPIRAAMQSVANDDPLQVATRVAMEFVEPIPILGSTRYGTGITGPVLETFAQATRSLRGDPLAYQLTKKEDTAAQAAARLYGSPVARLAGAPASGQVAKIIRGIDQEKDFLPSLLGTPQEQTPSRTRGRPGRRGRGISRSQ